MLLRLTQFSRNTNFGLLKDQANPVNRDEFFSILQTKLTTRGGSQKRNNRWGLNNLFYSRGRGWDRKLFNKIIYRKALFFVSSFADLRRRFFAKVRRFFWLGFFKIAPKAFWRRISLIFLKNGLFARDLSQVYFVQKKFGKALLERREAPIASVFLRKKRFPSQTFEGVNLRRRFNQLFAFDRFNRGFEAFPLFAGSHDSNFMEKFLQRDFFWKKCFRVNRRDTKHARYRKVIRMYIDKDMYRGFMGFEPWIGGSGLFRALRDDAWYKTLELTQLKARSTDIGFFRNYTRRLVKRCNKLRFERALFDQIGKFTIIWFHSIWGVYFRRQRRWRIVILKAIKRWYLKKSKAKKRKKNIKIKLTLLLVLYKALGFFGMVAGSFGCLLQIICLFFKKTRRYWAVIRIVKVVVSRVRVRLRTIKSFIMMISGRFGNKNRKSKSFIYLGKFLKVMDITYRVEYFYTAANSRAGVFGLSTWIQFARPFWGERFKSLKTTKGNFELLPQLKTLEDRAKIYTSTGGL